jgi:hypothetical protein
MTSTTAIATVKQSRHCRAGCSGSANTWDHRCPNRITAYLNTTLSSVSWNWLATSEENKEKA